MLRKAIQRALETLTQREEQVLRMRFGLTQDQNDFSLEDVAANLGVTRERIRQIEAIALRKLRDSQEAKDYVSMCSAIRFSK